MMIFGLHPVAFYITAGIAALLVLAPLIFLALGAAHKLTPALHADLWTRYKSWLFLVPLMVGPILCGRMAAILAVGVLGLLCFREFSRATGGFRDKSLAIVVVLGIALGTFAVADNWYGLFVALGSLVFSSMVLVALFADNPSGYIQRVALGAFAYLLFGVCLGHLGYLANAKVGVPLLLALVLCVELNDVFAYCSGKLFGNRRFIANTSPNKTWAGAVGALVLTTTLFGALIHWIYTGTALDKPWHWIAMGILVSVSGQWGDLVLSSIKRDLGIKDMAATIPGHGGLLDRFDSLLFVGPVLFHYIQYFDGVWNKTPVRILSGQ